MGGKVGAVAGVFYVVVVGMTVAVSATARSAYRTLPVAMVEAVPVLLLAGAVVWAGSAQASRAGRVCFVAAMILLTGGITASSLTSLQEPVVAVLSLAAASALLTVAYLCALTRRSERLRLWVIGITASLGFFALWPAGSATALAMKDTGNCGVDSCAWDGLAVVFGAGIACLLVLVAMLVAAFAADRRAGLGMLMLDGGIVLLLVVAPSWNRFQGIAGAFIAYVGLGLAALPWLAPRTVPSRLAPELP